MIIFNIASFQEIKPSGLVATEFHTLDFPKAKNTCLFYEYWDQVRGTNPIPNRKEINPSDIKSILPYVYLIEILEKGMDFKYRLIGTKGVEIAGQDYTNRLLSEFSDKENEWRVQLYKNISKTGKPHFIEVVLGDKSDIQRKVETAFLPLLDKSGKFNFIICVFDIV